MLTADKAVKGHWYRSNRGTLITLVGPAGGVIQFITEDGRDTFQPPTMEINEVPREEWPNVAVESLEPPATNTTVEPTPATVAEPEPATVEPTPAPEPEPEPMPGDAARNGEEPEPDFSERAFGSNAKTATPRIELVRQYTSRLPLRALAASTAHEPAIQTAVAADIERQIGYLDTVAELAADKTVTNRAELVRISGLKRIKGRSGVMAMIEAALAMDGWPEGVPAPQHVDPPAAPEPVAEEAQPEAADDEEPRQADGEPACDPDEEPDAPCPECEPAAEDMLGFMNETLDSCAIMMEAAMQNRAEALTAAEALGNALFEGLAACKTLGIDAEITFSVDGDE